jgi:tRNA A-37 threonylcarbamoyl transferase component Bud32/tetratricopeptide (TPR) repeat protein
VIDGAPLAAGDVVRGRFLVEGTLGAGAQAVVYRARDLELESQPVALKILRSELTESAVVVARLKREAQLARRLEHPRLVRIHDAIVEPPEPPLLVMELVPGGTLADRVRQGPLPLSAALAIADDVLSGLARLHAAGVIHRDLKPSNVLIDAAGRSKLTDFGIARVIDSADTRLTEEDAPLGSFDYAAPEQLAGGQPTERSDLYSFGLLLLDLLTGASRLREKRGIPAAIGRLRGGAPDVRRLVRAVPGAPVAVLQRLLDPDPLGRYASAEEVSRTLRAGARGRAPWKALAVLAVLILALHAPAPSEPVLTFRPTDSDGASAGVRAVGPRGAVHWTREGVDVDRVTMFAPRPRAPARVAALVERDLYDPREAFEISVLRPSDGEIVDRYPIPSDDARGAFPDFSPRFLARLTALDLDGDGGDELLVTFLHVPYEPSVTVLYEPRLGRARTVFAARGHHHPVAAVNTDGVGSAELLMAGVLNDLGWAYTATAVRLDPPVGVTGPSAPPARPPNEGDPGGALAWYAIAQEPICTRPWCVRLDSLERRIQFFGRAEADRSPTLEVDFDGFAVGSRTTASRGDRQQARWEAYRLLRLAESAGDETAVLDRALASARSAGDERLSMVLASKLRAAEVLRDVRSGHLPPEPGAEDRDPERAFEVAQTLHLAGHPAEALAWYRLALVNPATPEKTGRHHWELVHGLTFALVELERWEEAGLELDRFDAVAADQRSFSASLRDFVAWRRGEPLSIHGRPPPTGSEVDLARYVPLEIRRSLGEPAATLQPDVRAALALASEARAALLSLEAVLLAELGRDQEARRAATEALELAVERRARSVFVRVSAPLVERRWRQVHGAGDA